MTDPAAPKTRKPRQKKWASELARQAHSNMRRKLARESADREVATMSRARNELRSAERRLVDIEKNKRTNMVSNGLTPRLRAVMQSWGLNLSTQIKSAGDVSAWTDFNTIAVNYDRRLNEGQRHGELREISVEDLRQIAAETRGLFYHEVGHNLFTVPVAELLTLAWEEGHQVSDGSLVCLRNEPTPVDQRESIDRRISRIEYPSWSVSSDFQRAWNILEDQRMECLLVEESPRIAAYLTVLVLRQIVNNQGHQQQSSSWALVAGRKYLPRSVRLAAKAIWQPMSDTPVDADTVANLIDAYAKATDAVTMTQIIEAFAMAIFGTKTYTLDTHRQFETKGNGEAPNEDRKKSLDAPNRLPSKDEDQDEESDDESDSKDGSGAPTDEEVDGGGEGEGDQDDDGESSRGAGTGEHDPDDEGTPSDKSLREEAREAMGESLQDLENDATITEDVVAMNNAHDIDDGTLPTYGDRGPIHDDELASKAATLVDDFVRAFDIATADCTPHWESGQRRGVLEPIRYRTRQPGDMEIFKAYADEGEPGHDIAVSVFLDVSGSMSGSTDELGAAAWATKVACERIGVDCDVTLFDTGAWSLWGKDESPSHIQAINSHGGTDPSTAFDAILSQERDKTHHLVLVMTDGVWGGDSHGALRSHKHSNVRSMVFNYRDYGNEPMTPDPRTALQLSADEAYQISDLMDIPQALESMLVSLV